MKSKLLLLIKILVAVGLIYFVLQAGHLKLESLQALLTIPTIAVGLFLNGLNIWLLNWRWYWLLRSRSFPFHIIETFRLYLIGVFFNYALPGSVGGDVVKAYYLARVERSRRLDAALSVLLDRVLGLYSMLLLALAGVLWDLEFVLEHPQISVMVAISAILAVAMSMAFLIGFSDRFGRWLQVSKILGLHPKLEIFQRLFRAMQLYGERKWTIVISLSAGIAAQVVTIGFFVFVGVTLGFTDVPLTAYVVCIPLGFVATALPISPAGVGVGQIAFLYLFNSYHPGSGEMAATAITAFQLIQLVWGLLGAYYYVRQKAPQASEAQAQPLKEADA